MQQRNLRWWVLSVLLAGGHAAIAAGCGSSSSSTTSAGSQTASSGAAAATSSGGSATVLAAASLSKVLPRIEPNAKYTFGGSGALATDIDQGAPADVFAAASGKQPKALFAKGLVGKPVQFASNTLVLVVPRSNPAHIRSVSDITHQGVKLVICNATVPCGDYARTAFTNLGITAAAMKNVVSQTPDVTQTVAQVALGQADAGFVYITDAKAAGGKVAVVPLPAAAKPGSQGLHRDRQGRQEPGGGTGLRRRGALAGRSGQAAQRRLRPPVSAERVQRVALAIATAALMSRGDRVLGAADRRADHLPAAAQPPGRHRQQGRQATRSASR